MVCGLVVICICGTQNRDILQVAEFFKKDGILAYRVSFLIESRVKI